MSYGGHVLDMINRIKQNKELKQKHHERFQRIADAQGNTIYKKEIYKFKKERKLTEKELEHFRSEAKTRARRQLIMQVIALVVTLTVIILFLLIVN